MFDLGMQELIVIFIVALLVFGPKRLPELGRTLGKGLAELKKAMHGVKEQMDAEMREIKEPIEQIKKPLSFDMELYKKAEELAKKDAERTASEGAEQPAPAEEPVVAEAPSEQPAGEQTITGKTKKEEDSPKESS